MKNLFRSVWFHIIILSLYISLTVLMIYMGRQNSIDLQKKLLQEVTDQKAAQVDTFLKFQKEKLEFISTMKEFKDLVKQPKNLSNLAAAKNTINTYKDKIPGISILSSAGIVIIGEVDFPGTNYSTQPYFLLSNKKIVFELYYDPIRMQDYYAVVGPIYDDIEKTKVIGTIAYDISLDDISDLLKQDEENVMGEVYLINNKGLLLSRSKYLTKDPNAGILSQIVKSDGAVDCLEDLSEYTVEGIIEKHEEFLSEYTNYMGDDVYGAHAYANEINGCVIGEMNKEEVLKFPVIEYINNIYNIWNKK